MVGENSYTISRQKLFLSKPIKILSEDQVYSFCIFKHTGTAFVVDPDSTGHPDADPDF
jgi:hypothetical protein